MSCGEKVMNYQQIPPEELKPDFGENATIRWLIKEDDGAKAAAMRYFEVRPGGKIKPHHHPWEHEIFVVKGEGRLRIGRKWYDVRAGDFIYVPPNTVHEYINAGEESFEFICVIPLKPTVDEDKPLEC
ncbi:MAG: cupin domain-containing protein [Desulfurococcales archaeon]|nr:cupin domain-containing protein [Desulfurococcales archaeon]